MECHVTAIRACLDCGRLFEAVGLCRVCLDCGLGHEPVNNVVIQKYADENGREHYCGVHINRDRLKGVI